MTIDFSKLNTLGEIKGVQEGNKDVFNEEEKDLFTNNLIWKDIVNARKVGELLYRIKKAKQERKKNSKLQEDLENEETKGPRGSVAYRVLNINGLVDDTIDYLVFLARTDLPKDKTKRQEKINELQKEIDDKKLERANNNIALRPLERNFRRLIEDRDETKKTLQRRRSLSLLLRGGNPKITFQGSERELRGITLDTVNDYSTLDNLRSKNPPKLNDTAENILKTALDYLDIPKPPVGSLPYHKAEKLQYFDKRRYHTRQSLLTRWNNTGYSLLRCLRKIGLDKLEKIVDVSGSSRTDELKKTAKKIVDCIHWHEKVAEKKGYVFDLAGDTAKGWVSKYESWHKNLLKKEVDEFPYVPAVDWDEVIEFIMEVFPLSDTSDVGKDLVNKPYLHNSSSNEFISAPSSTKGWEEYFFVCGYIDAPPIGSKKSIGWYAEQPTTINGSTIKQQIKEGQEKVSTSWSFESLVKIWYHTFDAIYDFGAKDWRPGIVDEKFQLDFMEDNCRAELRFCKTMRELIKALELCDDEDEFDDILLEISDRAVKKSVSKGWKEADLKTWNPGPNLEYWKNIRNVLKENYDESRIEVLARLINRTESEVSVYDAKIKGIQDEINSITGKNSLVQFEIDKRQLQIDALKDLDDIQEKPLPEKKNSFNELYNKKSTQNNKWTITEIESMLTVLSWIKTEMESAGEDYKEEGFEDKETELKDILDEVGKINGDISRWEGIINNTSDKLPSSGVKEFLKNKDKLTFSLKDVDDWFKKLDEKIIISSYEKSSWDEVKKGIQNPKDYRDDPVSDITAEKLNIIFHTTGITADDIQESKWKSATEAGSFVTEANITKLIGDYYKGSTKPEETAFKTHLEDTADFGISGSDYWEKFVKKGPKFIIGAIRHYEWEHGKGKWENKPGDTTVTNAMTAANDKDKAKESGLKILEEWDISKPADIAEFLWRQELGKTGKELIKNHEALPSDIPTPSPQDEKGFLAHLKRNWIGYTIALVVLIALIGAAIWFWEDIKGMFGSGDANKDEENE